MKALVRAVLIAVVCCLQACQQQAPQISKHQLFVFGTLVDINIWHQDSTQVQLAVDAISKHFNLMHHQWHAWKPGRLQTINTHLRAGQSILLQPEEADFIQQTVTQARLSDHHFNPTIGELINLWGFHTDEYPILTPPPASQAISQLVSQQLTVDDLIFDGLQLSSSNPHIWLDFGGIAKGYAVDQAITILSQHGINNAIVNAGGDLRSVGSKGKQPWRIAIQSPTDWSMLAELVITGDEAVFTSGNYRRYKAFDGQRYAHILDPKTGQPVEQIVSATVITDQGLSADAAATALVVAGTDGWAAVARQMGIEQALIINDNNQCQATAAMAQRLLNSTVTCAVVN